MSAVWTLLPLLTSMVEEGPAPEDVKAGWLGFGVFLLLAVAVGFLGFSLRKHLRKVDFEEPRDGGAAPTTEDGEARNGTV